MKLKKNEVCPIHRTRFCCGREQKSKFKRHVEIKGPVTRIPDEDHPRGYRELCTTVERRRRVLQKLREQNGICPLCDKPIEHIREVVPDHIEPQPAGCTKDDHRDNLQAVHSLCNMEKGSRRL